MGRISPWPYRFISLTPSQVQERREVLDVRGTVAQASALLLLACVSLYWRTVESRPKPYLRSQTRLKNGVEEGTDKKRSWLDSPPVSGWRETRRQYLLTLGWAAWLVGLSAWRTGDDYLHLTKSLAHTAIATIPVEILISPRLSTRASPLLRLLGLPQHLFTPYHRLYGRLVLLPLLTSHAILYLTFFIRQALLSKRSRDADVQWGIFGVFLVLAIWSMSSQTPGVTRSQFYYGHVVAVMMLLAVAYFHVVYVRTYVLQAVGIYVLDVCWSVVEKVWGKSKRD